MLSKIPRVLALACTLQLLAYGAGAAAPGCATVRTITGTVEDCAKPLVQSSIAKVIPVVELVLTAAAEGDWSNLLTDLASMWASDGAAFVVCAVREVQAHARAQLAAPTKPGAAPSGVDYARALQRAAAYLSNANAGG